MTTYYVVVHLGNWVACYDYYTSEWHTADYVVEVDSSDPTLDVDWYSEASMGAGYDCADMVRNNPSYPGTGSDSLTINADCDVYPARAMPVARASAVIDHVRLYTDTSLSVYIDLSCRLSGRAVIREVENYGATCELTFVNDLQSTYGNLLSSGFRHWYDPSTGSTAAWSDGGVRGITTGMVLQIRETDSVGDCLGTFMVMTISASEELVTLTGGDFIQVLRATGAEYYRNHYSAGSTRVIRKECQPTTPDTSLIMDRPAGVLFSGDIAVGDVKYMVPVPEPYKTSESALGPSADNNGLTSVIYLGGAGSQYRIAGIVGLEYVKVYLGGHQYVSGLDTIYYSIELHKGNSKNGPLIDSWSASSSNTGGYDEITLTLSSAVDLSEYTYLTIYITGYHVNEYSQQLPAIKTKTVSATACTLAYMGTSYANKALYCEIGALEYKNCGGNNTVDAGNNPVFQITSIVDATPSSALLTLGMERAWATYVDAGSSIGLDTVASSIVDAAGGSLSSVTVNKDINMFRCGGDNYHAYLLALADMEDDSGTYEGRQHAFCATVGAWASVKFGVRYRADDTSQATLIYGGDHKNQSGVIVFKSFNPRITKAQRPSLALSKGTANDGTPIMVAVKDPDVAVGSSVVTLTSADSSALDSAFSAYSKIITNRSTDWEGEMELPGIHMGLMKRTGNWIGGVPVRIYDSRYGMNGYVARVKECTLDFQNQTTKLVLNNYSMMYSNDILDTSTMAFQAGNRAVLSTAAELYIRQYVFVDSGEELETGTSYAMQYYMDGAWKTSVSAEVIKYPELGVATVVAYFPIGVDYSSNQYPITKVRVYCDGVAGSAITIPSAVRPDKNILQYLIVNIQMTL